MAGLRSLLRKDEGITRGQYSGYFYVTIIFLCVLTILTLVSQNPSFQDLVEQIMIYSSMAVAFDIFTGFTGYFNLGFGAFTAIGAYSFTLGILIGVPLVASVFLGGFISGAFGFLMSYPFFRLRGGYFAIATLSLILLIQAFFTNLYQYTGGAAGIILPFSAAPLQPYILVSALALVILGIYTHQTIKNSRLGLALRGLKEDESVAESFGVNAFRLKQYVFVASAIFGGFSGGIFAIYLGFVSTGSTLGLNLDFIPLVSSLLGGSGIFLGPVLGAFVLTYASLNLPPLINRFLTTISIGPLVVTGSILVIVGLFMSGGILRVGELKDYAKKCPDKILSIWRHAKNSEVKQEQLPKRAAST